MTKKHGLWRAVTLTAMTSLCLFGLGACGSQEPATDSEETSARSQGQEMAGDAPSVLGVIPYFQLIEPSGLEFPFEELRGRLWVIGSLGDLPSTGPSSAVKKTWQSLYSALLGHSISDEFGLVSLAPAGTAAPRLAALAESFEADVLIWHFLSGDNELLNPLEARLGVGQNFLLVDRLGRLRGRFEQSEAGIEDLIKTLDRVAAETKPLPYPNDIMNPPWLEKRGRAQTAEVQASAVRHDFSFQDRLQGSGITFRNRTTEDSGKRYKSNHYDHGNGLLVADVDGDGQEDLYFLTQLGGNELWRNLGDGRFEDITSASGLAVPDRISVSGAFGDIDNDGDPDLFVTTVRQGNLLFENDGGGRFTEITEKAGVGEVAHSSGALFFDYDRDGLLDLLVTNVGRYTTDEKGPGDYWIGYQVAFDGHLKPERAERSTLYKNRGENVFEDVSEKVGLVEEGWNGDASIVDLDGDGWLDLYLTDMQGHDDVYRNVGGERFEPWREALFPQTPFGTMGIQVFDFDNDLRPDLFLTDMHTDMVRKFDPEEEKGKLPHHEMPPLEKLGTDGDHVRGNAFFLNRGDRFEEVSDTIGAENYWPWGLSSGDLNADGFEDAYLTSSMSYGWRYAVDSLLLNESGKRFVSSEFAVGIEPRRDHLNAIPWYELDCSEPAEEENYLCFDGDVRKEGVFEVWGALGSRSSVIFDLDHDGDLDIVVNEFNAPPRVLISDLSERGDLAYIELELEGTRSNRDAIGAAVVVRAGDASYRKVIDGNAGYLSFSPQVLYFGLAAAKQVDSLHITWPSGTVQEIAGPIEINQRMKIVEE